MRKRGNMRKIMSLLLAVLMLLACVALVACDRGEKESSESESESSQSQSESKTESESESESEEPKDPADIIDPNAPADEEITLFEGTSSDYVFCYDKSDEMISKHAQAFSAHIKEAYGITLEEIDIEDAPSERKIIFGSSADTAEFVVKKLYEVNDFAISVCGNDLVIYATGEPLYPYVLDILKKTFDGEKTDFTPDDSIIYHKSKYKDMTYAQYIADGKPFNATTILDIFEAREFVAEDGTKLPYRIYIPSCYNEKEKLPVVTILHGAGERGSDNARQLVNMVPELFSQTNGLITRAIVIAPQCPSYPNQWVDTPWGEGNYLTSGVEESNELKAVVELIEKTKAELVTDEDRYYVMGISMGGFGTWDLIARHTDMFAAAVPLCGGADTSMADKLVDFPIWTVHSSNDDVVPYGGTRDMVAAIKNACELAGVDPKITFETKSFDHNVWTYAGNSIRIVSWLFQQKLSDRALDGE